MHQICHSVIVSKTDIVICSVEAIIGDVRLEWGKGIFCCSGSVSNVLVGSICGWLSVSVNRKSIVGVSIMIRSMFGLLVLCKGRKSERLIGRVLSLFACIKSTDFYGRHVGLFAIGADGAWR